MTRIKHCQLSRRNKYLLVLLAKRGLYALIASRRVILSRIASQKVVEKMDKVQDKR